MHAVAAFPIAVAAGGSFLLEPRTPEEIFTPEDLNEEQRQIAATAEQFAREQILPRAAAIERKEPGAMPALLRQAAELGFTAVDVPEEYGGLGMDRVSSTLITDHISVLSQFFNGFRRARRHRHAAAGMVRHRRTEAALSPQAGHVRVDRGVWALRGEFRLRRHEHPHAGDAFA